MKYKISAFCLFVLSPLFIFSQGEFSYDIELEYVNFSNGSSMRMDDNSGNYTNVNEYEHAGGDIYVTAPVAYVAGNSFFVDANFQTSCPSSLFIRGKHFRPDATELIFTAQEITPDVNGALQYTAEQPMENGNVFSFPVGTVEYHDPFEILWQFSMDNSSNDNDWLDIHTSANPVYVSKASPNFNQSVPQLRYHTYFKTSCRAADGLTDNDAIINAVWEVFTTLNSFVRADDDGTLAYYEDWTDAYFWADSMIHYGNGQCSAYSMAFLNCLKIQGIDQQNDYLWINPVLPQSNETFGFLINDFTSTTTVPFGHWSNNTAPTVPAGFDIDRVVVPHQDDPYNFTSSIFAENVLYSEIADDIGVPGQSEANPKSVFVNHQIIRLDVGGNTILYDVPYGVTYNSIDEMKANIFGYIYEVTALINEITLDIDLNGGGKEANAAVTVWLIDTDPNALNLEIDPNNSF